MIIAQRCQIESDQLEAEASRLLAMAGYNPMTAEPLNIKRRMIRTGSQDKALLTLIRAQRKHPEIRF